MSYVDSDSGLHPVAAPKKLYEAFFIEDKSEYIKRNNLIEIKALHDPFKNLDIADKKTEEWQYQFSSVLQNVDKLSVIEAAKIELFQNLIFNNDWYLKLETGDLRSPDRPQDLNEMWNIRVFQLPVTGKWSLLSQDFNFSAIPLIENLSPIVSQLPFSFKFLSNISQTDRVELANILVSKKTQIASQADLISGDASYLLIKEFLIQRVDRLIGELQK